MTDLASLSIRIDTNAVPEAVDSLEALAVAAARAERAIAALGIALVGVTIDHAKVGEVERTVITGAPTQ
jgi:hypothetical protein